MGLSPWRESLHSFVNPTSFGPDIKPVKIAVIFRPTDDYRYDCQIRHHPIVPILARQLRAAASEAS